MNLLQWEQILTLKLNPVIKGVKYDNGRVVSPENALSHLKVLEIRLPLLYIVQVFPAMYILYLMNFKIPLNTLLYVSEVWKCLQF